MFREEESREFKSAVNFIKNINACQRICDPENVIISFNWDLLVEHAAKILNVGHSYGFDGEGILILKPHGSINWIRTANYDGAQILNHPKIAVINPCKYDIAKYEKIFRSIDIVEPCAFEFSRYV